MQQPVAFPEPLAVGEVITEYELYSDERFEARGGSTYLSMGGLICTDRGRGRLLARLHDVRRQYEIHKEIRWVKISNRHLHAYRSWLDVFFDDPYAKYVLLSVNRSSHEWRAFRRSLPSRSRKDDALASAYYQFLLIAFGRLRDTKRWWVYPDAGLFSQDKVLDRIEFLFNRTYKKAFGPKSSRIIRMSRSLDSKSNDLIQLTDVLLGCAACVEYGFVPQSTSRGRMLEHFMSRCASSTGHTRTGLRKIVSRSWVPPDRFNYNR